MQGTRCRDRMPGPGCGAGKVGGCWRSCRKRECPSSGAVERIGLSLYKEWIHVIAVTGLELRAGAQLLLEGATFQISPGDKVGLVGRNGAGKTTLARVLAG